MDAGIGEAAIASEAGAKGAESAGAAKGAESAAAAGGADLLAPEGLGAMAFAPEAEGGLGSMFGGMSGWGAGETPFGFAATGPESLSLGGAVEGAPSAAAFAPPAGVSPGALAVDPTAALQGGVGAIESGGGAGAALGSEGGAALAGEAGSAMSGGEAALGADAAKGGFSLDALVKGAGESLTKNPLGIGLGAAGLGYSMMQGQKTSAATDALKTAAEQQGAQGAIMRNYLATGTLPEGLQKSVDLAVKSSKARIIANYAGRGLPTDPSKNSALASELAGAEQMAVVTAAQIGERLMSAGLSESGMANQLYMALQKIDQQQSDNIGKSIAAMAAALGGGSAAKIGA